MNKFGVQCLNKESDEELKEKLCICDSTDEHKKVRETLRQFQQGYTERNLEKIGFFMEEVFIDANEVYILGTGTGELSLGINEVRDLINDDWQYWGDLYIDCENANITLKGDVAWISSRGSVKHTFEDSPQRYDSYVNFIKEKVEDDELTSKQKITYINWVLALSYHQRSQDKREYLWPLILSGVLLRDKDKWKFVHINFSIPKANFPDERFENSKQHIEKYNEQNNKVNEYKFNQITPLIKCFLKNFEADILKSGDIIKERLEKYFTKSITPYVIGPENQWHYGIDKINEFFTKSDQYDIDLNIEQSIVTQSGEITWVTVNGILKQNLSEEELIQRSLEEMKDIFQSNFGSEEKLFSMKRTIAYALKECSMGTSYTCPIRMTAVILNSGENFVFNSIHFSFPFYWIFEGKLDDI